MAIGDRTIEYELRGNGPAVVLSSPSWWPLDAWKLSGFPELADFRVLAFNHRGVGASSPASGPYTVDDLAGDLVELMDALRLERAHLVGFAIGGVVAIRAALANSRRVASLVVGAAGRGSPANAPSPSAVEREAIGRLGYRDFIRQHALNDRFAFSPRGYKQHPDRAEALADALWLNAGSQEEFLKHAEARRGYDALENAANLRMPVLVLVGGEDNVARGLSTPLRFAQELANAIPDARLHVLPGIRHMTFWEQPDQAWAAVRDFWQETKPR